jgi:hypothetical protein
VSHISVIGASADNKIGDAHHMSLIMGDAL